MEVMYADAPAITRSMRACIERLKHERLYVVYPGCEAFALRPDVKRQPQQNRIAYCRIEVNFYSAKLSIFKTRRSDLLRAAKVLVRVDRVIE